MYNSSLAPRPLQAFQHYIMLHAVKQVFSVIHYSLRYNKEKLGVARRRGCTCSYMYIMNIHIHTAYGKFPHICVVIVGLADVA